MSIFRIWRSRRTRKEAEALNQCLSIYAEAANAIITNVLGLYDAGKLSAAEAWLLIGQIADVPGRCEAILRGLPR